VVNIPEIQDCLEPWMRVDTWHTTHPMDEERFHKALHRCFQQAGQSIDFDSFKDAMTDLAQRLHPKLGSEYLESTIDRYAQNAETISSYLFDIGQFNK
tara:strand:- start:681 stop:974 length:294 start_codon:yes stop_codon:yes gene_type:complete